MTSVCGQKPTERLSWASASFETEMGYGKRMLSIKDSFVAWKVTFKFGAQNTQWYAPEE